MHAVAYTFGDVQRYGTYSSAVASIVASDLRHGGFVRGVPLPEGPIAQHRRDIVEMTLLRRKYLRARSELESPFVEKVAW